MPQKRLRNRLPYTYGSRHIELSVGSPTFPLFFPSGHLLSLVKHIARQRRSRPLLTPTPYYRSPSPSILPARDTIQTNPASTPSPAQWAIHKLTKDPENDDYECQILAPFSNALNRARTRPRFRFIFSSASPPGDDKFYGNH